MLDLLKPRSWGLPAADADRDAAARHLDEQFEELVQRDYRRIYQLAYRMVHSETDAADITQETFLRVYRALPRLRADAAMVSWVRRIATNLCLDHLRRRRSAPSTFSLDTRRNDEESEGVLPEIADPAADPALLCADLERNEVIYRAVAGLQPDYRVVIVLHHLEEMGVDEIAGILGIPTGTVKSRLSRARKALQKSLSSYFA